MSISTGPKNVFPLKKIDKIGSSMKVMAKKAIKGINNNTFSSILILLIIISGIGESMGRDYSWKWYLIVFVILSSYVADWILTKTKKENG